MNTIPKSALLLFLLIFCSTSAHAQFLSQISSTSTVVSNDVALDSAGNAYVTGGFIGDANFRDTTTVFTLSSLGLKDIFIAKYNPQGRPLWGFSIGGVAGGPGLDDEGVSIAVSPAGNLFVTGYFQGTADFDPGSGVGEATSQGFRDVFIASYTSDGDFRWVQSFGGTADDIGQGVGLEGDDAVLLTGFFRETATLSSDTGGANAVTSAGQEDGYLISLNANGALNWIFSYGDISVDKGRQVETDGSGNVYLTGVFSRNADFDPSGDTTTLSSLAGGQDGVLASYDNAGALRWAIPLGSELIDSPEGLAVDPAGDVFITGHFTGTLDFDPLNNTPNEFVSIGRDIYIASYSEAGAMRWATVMGSGFAEGSDVSVNNSGNIIMTGFFSGEVFPDAQSTLRLTSNGEQDILLASYTSNGTFQWGHAIGGALAEVPQGVAIGADGSAFLTGYFEDLVDFNPSADTLEALSSGAFDGFLARYASDGSFAVSSENEYDVADAEIAFNVFPNPTANRLSVVLQNHNGGDVKVEILDTLGRRVHRLKRTVPINTTHTLSLDVSEYPAGLYFIRVTNRTTRVSSFAVVR